MNDRTDSQLLSAYAKDRSEADFTELVHRHVDFVYSAALRLVRDPHLAEDVTQGAFAALAKSAAQLTDRPVLSGWLHRTALNIAAQTVRTIERRRAREQEAAAMNTLLSADSDSAWETIAPQLDAALDELSEADRDALLLRYFERKSAREMALALGTSEDAAQKRVNRAVERLRELFAKRGVSLGAGGLAVVLSAHAVQAAPVGLVVTISSTAGLAGTLVHTSTAIAATKGFAMTALNKILFATAIVAAGIATPLAVRYHAQVKQLEHDEALRSQAEPSTPADGDVANTVPPDAVVPAANGSSAGDSTRELLRLRAQVARLQSENQDLTRLKLAAEDKTPAGRARRMKAKLDEMPQYKIPELQLLGNSQWEGVANVFGTERPLETEDDYRRTFGLLRQNAKQQFGHLLSAALHLFADANAGQLPTDLSQLKPYLTGTVTDEMLQRYELKQTGKLSDVPLVGDYQFGRQGAISGVPRTEPLAVEKAPVDDRFDTLFSIEAYGFSSKSVGDQIGSGWGTYARRDANGAVQMIPAGRGRNMRGGAGTFGD